MRELMRIREAIRKQRYRVSAHANEELSEDDLEIVDVKSIVLSGQIRRKFTRDPRDTRYEILGAAADHRQANVVRRFLPSGVLLIKTHLQPLPGHDRRH